MVTYGDFTLWGLYGERERAVAPGTFGMVLDNPNARIRDTRGLLELKFEKAFATFCDTSHSVAVSSGTDALRFALMASGVKPGDVVVTVPHTFITLSPAA